MKDNKLLISLLVIFLTLIAVLAIYGGTVGISEDKMMPYDFVNFTMDIPKGDFVKENFTDNVSTFTEENNEYMITFMNSANVYQNIVDYYMNFTSKNSFEYDGNLTIIHINDEPGTYVQYSEIVLTKNGDMLVMIQGNDVELQKEMAGSVNFYVADV